MSSRYLTISILLLLSLTSCKNDSSRRDANTAPKWIPDSLIASAPILPDDYLTDEENLRSGAGLQLGREVTRTLILADKGICFPKGIIPDKYDFENIFLPRIHLYLAGLWNVSDSLECFIIKWENWVDGLKDDNGVYYLVLVNREGVLRSWCIANVIDSSKDIEMWCEDDNADNTEYCKRLSRNTFMVYQKTIDGKLLNKTKYRILEDGTIKVLYH